jgi:hypothetical protein
MKYLLPILFVIISSVSVSGQGNIQGNKVFVQGEYVDVSLLDFLREIEQTNNIKFHYLNDVVKDVKVTGVFKHKTELLTALNILLANHAISCSENGEGGIVLFANKKKLSRKVTQYSTVSGRIVDGNGNGIPFANAALLGPATGSLADENGNFKIKLVPQGQQLLQCSSVGYESVVIKIDANEDVRVDVSLQERTHELEEIVISPSTFEISTVEATPLTLGKDEILHSPNMGKDIYRTLRTLPGVANNDYSAKARIRGGHSEEAAVYLDNFLINDAFHLDEVDGSFSIFNTDYIDELKVLTGGYNARYTDRMSGVVDVRTSDRLEADRYKLSIDLLNASFLVQKRVNDKLGVFFNARRGYLDFLLRDMGTGDAAVEPRFSDLWSKITYKANLKNSMSFNFLLGRDKFSLSILDDLDGNLVFENTRNNINAWVNWKWFPSERFDAITTVGYQDTGRDAVFTFLENITKDNLDKNRTKTFVLTNNSNYHLNEFSDIEFGTELKYFNSDYRYREERYAVFTSTPENIMTESLDIDNSFTGYTAAFFAQYNVRLWNKLSVQPGIRTSSQSFSKPMKVAPRIALSYDITPSLTTRWAYGIYNQPDSYYRLRSSQFQEDPYDLNGKVSHYTGALTFSTRRINAMLNVYYKKYDQLFDDYRYEFFNRLGGVSVLDIPFNTTSGYSQGAEIMVRYNYGKASMLSVAYAYSKNRIRNAAGEETFRDFDRPHTVIVNNIFRLPQHWNISIMWSFHSGDPYTPINVDFIHYRPEHESVVLFYEAGIKNSGRLPSFRSVDVRVEKTWFLGKNQLSAYINFINLFDHENIKGYWWFAEQRPNGSVVFERENQLNIPSFVSPGLSFTLF